MTPEQLKASIIHLALQGKLVEQRPEEGDAEELYRQIQEEKDKLIKLKIIKLDKNIPEPDEYPYDIPESWIWARITDCGSFISGYTPKPLELKSEGVIPYFKVADMNTEGNEVYLSITNSYLKDDNSTKYQLKNTIVYPKNGGAVFTNKKRILAQNSVVDLNTGGYSVIGPVSLMYFYLYFSQIDFRQCYKGTALPTIDMDKLKRKWIPLPPLKEQHRIVAKIEELLPFVDRYAASYEKLEQFNAKFPEEMKKSILQYAIQGKLVEQREEEGTAEDLYRQIQEEKQKLIKGGTIKKEKPLPEITSDEIPFDIPVSWKWVRLGKCGIFERGSGIKKDEVTPEGLPCVRYGQLYTTYKTRFAEAVSYVPQDIFDKCHKANQGDILMSLTGENEYDIALAVTYEGTDEIAYGGDMTRFYCHCMNPLYLTYVLNSRYGILCKSKLASGNIIVHISNDKLATIPIPLPPLEEQHRIVAKIEELLPYCDKLANKK